MNTPPVAATDFGSSPAPRAPQPERDDRGFADALRAASGGDEDSRAAPSDETRAEPSRDRARENADARNCDRPAQAARPDHKARADRGEETRDGAAIRSGDAPVTAVAAQTVSEPAAPSDDVPVQSAQGEPTGALFETPAASDAVAAEAVSPVIAAAVAPSAPTEAMPVLVDPSAEDARADDGTDVPHAGAPAAQNAPTAASPLSSEAAPAQIPADAADAAGSAPAETLREKPGATPATPAIPGTPAELASPAARHAERTDGDPAPDLADEPAARRATPATPAVPAVPTRPQQQAGDDNVDVAAEPQPGASEADASPDAVSAAAESAEGDGGGNGAADRKSGGAPASFDSAVDRPSRTAEAVRPAFVPEAPSAEPRGAAHQSGVAPTTSATPAGFAGELRGATPTQPGTQNPAPDGAGRPQLLPSDQLAVELGRAVRAGRDHFTLELRPAELGRISVDLRLDDEHRVTAMIRVERPETLHLLQRDAHTLERALQDAGLRTDSGSLSFDLRGGGRGMQDFSAPSGEARPIVLRIPTQAAEAAAQLTRSWRFGEAGVDISV